MRNQIKTRDLLQNETIKNLYHKRLDEKLASEILKKYIIRVKVSRKQAAVEALGEITRKANNSNRDDTR